MLFLALAAAAVALLVLRWVLPASGGAGAARERQLARLISGMQGVERAEVLLGEGSASVALELEEGGGLTPEAASTVAALVASAVPGLGPEDVVVADDAHPGRSYRRPSDEALAEEGASLLRLKASVERALEGKLRALFARMQIECAAAVSAELDLDRVRESHVELDPLRRGEFVLREERTRLPGPGGANVEESTTAGRPSVLPAEGAGRTETRSTEASVGYLTRDVEKAIRGLTRVRASVVLFDRLVRDKNGRLSYDTDIVQGRLDRYRDLAAAAIGADRLDVELQHLPSPRPEPEAEARAPAAWPLWAFGALLGAALVVLLFFSLVSRRAKEVRARAEEAGIGEVPPAALGLREEAAELAGRDAELAAAVLRRWIAQEG